MKLNTVTMRQSLSCYRISTCLPCSHHLHSFQFILLSIFYIFFFVCEKVHGPFFNFVSLEAVSTGERFSKSVCLFFFYQKLRAEWCWQGNGQCGFIWNDFLRNWKFEPSQNIVSWNWNGLYLFRLNVHSCCLAFHLHYLHYSAFLII